MKYFVVSDIHGFYKQLKNSLDVSGYDKANKEHILIVIGDIFDRGNENRKVYRFLTSIPKDRIILIKGNHEQLYLDLLEKDYPENHDFHNGTISTFCEISKTNEEDINSSFRDFGYFPLDKESLNNWDEIKRKVNKSVITKWLKSNVWKDYYEFDNFIFVHSFIPVMVKQDADKFVRYWEPWRVNPKLLEPVPEWRSKASEMEWNDSRWGCPWQQFKEGLFEEEAKKGKILVCGHWHTSDFFAHLKNIFNQNGIYFSKNLIAIDDGISWDRYYKCYNKHQNVLVIDNGKCYNESNEELKERDYVPKIETTTVNS